MNNEFIKKYMKQYGLDESTNVEEAYDKLGGRFPYGLEFDNIGLIAYYSQQMANVLANSLKGIESIHEVYFELLNSLSHYAHTFWRVETLLETPQQSRILIDTLTKVFYVCDNNFEYDFQKDLDQKYCINLTSSKMRHKYLLPEINKTYDFWAADMHISNIFSKNWSKEHSRDRNLFYLNLTKKILIELMELFAKFACMFSKKINNKDAIGVIVPLNMFCVIIGLEMIELEKNV